MLKQFIPKIVLVMILSTTCFIATHREGYGAINNKIDFTEEQLIGGAFISKLRRFHCLCGTRVWCSEAIYREVLVKTGLKPQIRSKPIDGSSLPSIILWKRASKKERDKYKGDSIIQLPWYLLTNKRDFIDPRYIIMQCNNPQCEGVKNAILQWNHGISRYSLAQSEPRYSESYENE